MNLLKAFSITMLLLFLSGTGVIWSRGCVQTGFLIFGIGIGIVGMIAIIFSKEQIHPRRKT